MKVRVEHIALIQCQQLDADSSVQLSEGATITDLLNQIGIAAEHQRAVVPFINSEKAKRSHVLSDGDTVFLSLAIGGGTNASSAFD